jgi:hypothetical protein
MKAQNLFILLFGIMLFAAAIYFGIKTVNMYSASANRDQLISAVYDYGVMAQKYRQESINKYREKSYENWIFPKHYENSEYGYFRSVSSKDHVDILSVGNQTGLNGFTNVRVTARIDSSGIKVVIIN